MSNGQKITAPLFAPYSVNDNTESRFISELLDDTDMGDNTGDSDGGEGDSDAEGENNSNFERSLESYHKSRSILF